jgi:hypothetical protein
VPSDYGERHIHHHHHYSIFSQDHRNERPSGQKPVELNADQKRAAADDWTERMVADPERAMLELQDALTGNDPVAKAEARAALADAGFLFMMQQQADALKRQFSTLSSMLEAQDQMAQASIRNIA